MIFDSLRLQPGHELAGGKYVVTETIGSGAMGTVYRGEHRALQRNVAIKVLHPEVFERQPKAARRFEREARAAAQLDHPNSVRVLDFGIEGPLHYLIMEFVEGRSLDGVVAAEGPMDSARIARLMCQVCSALAKAHDEGTVHRDLKPQNILLVPHIDDDGMASEQIKVCDFGIAKVNWADPGEVDDALTDVGSVMGTPQYMSPEQCQAHDVDARSDLYSVGCVMYFLATGHHAFQGPTPLTTMLMHIQDTARPPSELNPGLDPELEAIMLKAMAKERAERPQSARALRHELGALSGLTSAEFDVPATRPATDQVPLASAPPLAMAPTSTLMPVSGSSPTAHGPQTDGPAHGPTGTRPATAETSRTMLAAGALMASLVATLAGLVLFDVFGSSSEERPHEPTTSPVLAAAPAAGDAPTVTTPTPRESDDSTTPSPAQTKTVAPETSAPTPTTVEDEAPTVTPKPAPRKAEPAPSEAKMTRAQSPEKKVKAKKPAKDKAPKKAKVSTPRPKETTPRVEEKAATEPPPPPED
ncbi:MAG: protein kinase, partial [Myxococcota bacterium]|nr:protein kinase [Myxococcota bacterium]